MPQVPAALDQLDMPKSNAYPVTDSNTDRDAGGANIEAALVAGMSHAFIRAWGRFTLSGSAAPALVAHDAQWGSTPSVAPVGAHVSTGTSTITWPSTVSDEIPIGTAGYSGPLALNLKGALVNVRAAGTAYLASVTVVSANVVTIQLFTTSGALVDPPSAVDVDVFAI